MIDHRFPHLNLTPEFFIFREAYTGPLRAVKWSLQNIEFWPGKHARHVSSFYLIIGKSNYV